MFYKNSYGEKIDTISADKLPGLSHTMVDTCSIVSTMIRDSFANQYAKVNKICDNATNDEIAYLIESWKIDTIKRLYGFNPLVRLSDIRSLQSYISRLAFELTIEFLDERR